MSAGTDGHGWFGDGDNVETSCKDRGGDMDESSRDGRGWVQISVPMQLSSVGTGIGTMH